MNRRHYAVVTSAYWGFTLTDGALRMLVLLYFHERGVDAISLAFLFLLYEFCGVLTNLLGGWWASRSGLKVTLVFGLLLQVVALTALSVVNQEWMHWQVIAYIMGTQALSGVAKDLTKMSAKSAVKVLAPGEGKGLLKWVSILTGSKNALKGVGFFLGGVLLQFFGFQGALLSMAACLAVVFFFTLFLVKGEFGKVKKKLKFSQLFSKSREINYLSAARLCLFAARDVWFVVGLPVFLADQLNWSFSQVGGFMALWVIGYGVVQAFTPALIKRSGAAPATLSALKWVFVLLVVALTIALLVQFGIQVQLAILAGLMVYGFVFAMNSALHSYLVLAFTDDEDVTLNVGFYYMANAWGRLLGTLCSGLAYYYGGLSACLWASAVYLVLAACMTVRLKTVVS